MEIVEQFPSPSNMDSKHGYQRIVPQTQSSQVGTSGSRFGDGEGTSGGDAGHQQAVGHQQAMYGVYGEYGQ